MFDILKCNFVIEIVWDIYCMEVGEKIFVYEVVIIFFI